MTPKVSYFNHLHQSYKWIKSIGGGWIPMYAPWETGTLIQHLRPLDHTTQEAGFSTGDSSIKSMSISQII